MFVEDIKKDFYDYVGGKQIFLMIHGDIDGICSCKILQNLLTHRHTIYTLTLIDGVEDLKKTYAENCEDVKHFVLVNCGGTVDLVDLLEPEDDVVFFVLDSHRPMDLCNVYSNGQIRMIVTDNEEQNIPSFHSVFRDDSSDEDDGDEEGSDEEGNSAKRRRLDEAAIEKRRERRQWEENRDKVVFDYSQFSYYGKASAMILFDLAWKLSRDNKDVLWWAIVALTEQMVFSKISNTQYVLDATSLQAHVTRLQNRTQDTDVATSLKVSFEKDLRLCLYRHWTAESSLKYSPYTASKLKLWSVRGEKRLRELLVDMGLPIIHSKRVFSCMDLQYRKEFHENIEKLSEKYGLTDVTYASFTLSYGYTNRYSAADVVYAMTAILEAGALGKNEDPLLGSLHCLSRTKSDVLRAGIARARAVLEATFKEVQKALETKRVVSSGPFLYLVLPEGSAQQLFSRPHVLSMLARFALGAYASSTRNKRAASLPLVVSAPSDLETGLCLLIGVPPLCENSPKNLFGKAFEQAAERIDCRAVCDYFDTSYFTVHARDRTRFFDALTTLLS